MNPFAEYLARTAEVVQRELQVLFEAEAERIAARTPELTPMFKQVRELTERGGKRLRAALVLLGYRVVAGDVDPVAALPAAAAMELLQTYFLVHDDWMDDDPVRRGGPSVHVALRDTYGSRRVGDAGAILAGDYAVSLAQQVLLRSPVGAAERLAAATEFAALQRDVVLGQCLDVLVSEAGDRPGALTDLMQRTHLLKTAAYTTTGPLLIGAALAGGRGSQLDALRAFGDPLGVAFQLRDDWLGTFGDPALTGKSIDSDLREGKKTAVLSALDRDPSQHGALRAFVGGGAGRARSDAEIADMRRRLEQSGASAALAHAVEEENGKAGVALRALGLPADVEALFRGMMTLIAERRT